MKILFLNPHVDAQHKIAQALKARGIAALMPSNSEEGWQVLKLHGSSVDLAIIHREGVGGGDTGLELLYKIKKDPAQADLPVVLTSETWTAEQCASHQQTRMGANAYLNWPFDEKTLLATIDAIFAADVQPVSTSTGLSVASATSPSMPVGAPMSPPQGFPSPAIGLEAPISPTPLAPPDPSLSTDDGASGIVLEEASSPDLVLSQAQPSIQIDLPKMEEALPALPSQAEAPVVEAPVAEAPAAEAPQVAHELPSDSSELLDVSMPGLLADDAAEAPQADEPDAGDQDPELASEMPYLFSKGDQERSAPIDTAALARVFQQPMGDAVVPGGAAHSPDLETLKKYLLLREQDVAALSSQLKAAQDELNTVKAQMQAERKHSEDLQFQISDQKRKIEDFEREKALAIEGVSAEIAELRFQAKAKTDKAKLLEVQVKEASDEIEKLKDRVRSDIRKIRVRERELENKLEISKKDSEAILTARENKIIELKRKLDLLEFNLDLLQDRYNREKESSAKLREKLAKAAQVVRVAEGLLDEPGTVASTPAPMEDTKAS